MIKQTWYIPSTEKKRILSLHESATKNLYLIKEQNEEPIIQNSIPKNVNFLFSLKPLGQPMSLPARTDDQGNVYVEWQGEERKLPTIQEIGQPKFIPTQDYLLESIEEWDWLNSFNDQMATNTRQSPFYIPSYDKSTSQLHFLIYQLLDLGKRDRRSRTQSNDFLQANDNKYMTMGNYNLIVKGDDLPTSDRIVATKPIPKTEIPSKEISLNLNISDPFEFDSTNLTPEGQSAFDDFVENLKKYIDLYSGDVEVITSSSIDADPKDKATYNMNLSLRRANAIINALKSRLGQTNLNFIPKPLGQTDQFARGMRFPKVRDKKQTAPNRRLIINLPKRTVTEQ